LALYRSGRQADALAVYRDGRRRLVADLGLEPGPELQALERAILTQDPAIAAPADGARGAARDTSRPARGHRDGRRGRVAAAGGAAVLAVAAIAVTAALLAGRGDRSG